MTTVGTGVSLTSQVFYDLCRCLSLQPDTSLDDAVLGRLQAEHHYLGICYLANQYWLGSALFNALHQKHVFSALPDALKDYLSSINDGFLQRHQQIQQEVLYACGTLQDAGITPVLIKGGASLFNRTYSAPHVRFMADIDILVSEADFEQAHEVLQSAGYCTQVKPSDAFGEGMHHGPPLKRPEGPCFVEVHRRTTKLSLVHLQPSPLSHTWPLKVSQTCVVQQLSPTEQVILTIVHSELADKGFADEFIDLRQLWHLAHVINTFSADIDWPDITQRFDAAGQREVLDHTLFSVSRLFNIHPPVTPSASSRFTTRVRRCVENYIVQHAHTGKRRSLATILKGYSRETIIDLYGDEGILPVLRGRIQHLKRHIRLATKSVPRANDDHD